MTKTQTLQKTPQRQSGLAIPVSALQTENSLGCGEYLDLIPFANFCKKSNLSIIQILPVNDTGTESSPYSALSAFALHPLYIRISEIEEFSTLNKSFLNTILTDIEEKKVIFVNEKRFQYKELREFKLSLLKKIWEEIANDFIVSKEAKDWIAENPWIKSYACFMLLKEKNLEASFKTWKEFSRLNNAEITELWNMVFPKNSLYYYVWIQKNASLQLKKASDYCKSQNILLKGDIPILMNEDSADIWSHPEFFIENLRAGSPPDGFNPDGQNWGFPIYNWKKLKEKDYSWWKDRLLEAAKYYHMYRIDHVLGFFRIWAVPEGETKAVLGRTEPHLSITRDELKKCTLTDETIRWLSQPHIATRDIEAVNNGDYLGTHGILSECMDRIGTEELWLFKNTIKTDSDIWALDIPFAIKEKLAEKWLDRCFIEIDKNNFLTSHEYKSSTSWKSLNEGQVLQLEKLFLQKKREENLLWEKQAMELLGALSNVGEMIVCAEDLGAGLESMPRVLKALSINALRVVRWNRLWKEDGQPFVDFPDYPPLSVTTSSVHDSSTLRAWWDTEEDSKDFGRRFLYKNKQNQTETYTHPLFSPDVCNEIFSRMADTNSNYFINPIQDFLHLDPQYYDENCDDERINIPGTVNTFNWTYKLPVFIEELEKNNDLIKKIKNIVAIHTKNEVLYDKS